MRGVVFGSLQRNPRGSADRVTDFDDASLFRQIRVERLWEPSDEELAAVPQERVNQMMPLAVRVCAEAAVESLF